MIGNNACGSRALGYGRTSDNVIALDVVTGTGERLRAHRFGDAGFLADARPRCATWSARNLATIRTEFGRFGRQVSGYSLEHLLPERGFDVTKAFVRHRGHARRGARGDRRLVRTPAATVLVALGYADMASAADAVPALLPLSPIAVEGLDRRIVDVVVASRGPGGGAGAAARQRLAVRRARRRLRRGARSASPTGVIAAAGALDARVVDRRGRSRGAVAHP